MITPCAFRPVTVYLKARASFTDYGEPVPSTATTARGSVNERVTTARDSTGQEVRARALVILPATTTVAAGCRLSIDGGTDYYDVIEVRKPRTLAGAVSHLEVLI